MNNYNNSHNHMQYNTAASSSMSMHCILIFSKCLASRLKTDENMDRQKDNLDRTGKEL